MKSRLGDTQIEVCPLVFGTLPLGPLQADLAPAGGARLIRFALEQGVNLIDTAELYGTYAHIRGALEGFSGEVRIATKTHAPTAALAREHLEKAFRELGRDYLDIVHVHGARLADPFTERAEVFELLHRMKEEGRIGAVGLSSHYISVVRRAAGRSEAQVIHPLINREGRGILDGGASEMAEAISAAAAAGKGIYAMKAMAGGNLIAQARASLAYVRDLPGVQGVAVGMLSEKEILANLALLERRPEDEALWGELEKGRRRLQIMEPFCKGCGACAKVCVEGAMTMDEGRAKVNQDACVLCGYCAAACPEFIIRVV